jgi:hypothetical protein
VVLPPGTYTFSLDPAAETLAYVVTLRGEKILTSRGHAKTVMVVPQTPPSWSDHTSGPDQLTAVRTGRTYRIISLELGSVGLSESYAVPKREREMLAREMAKLPVPISAMER